MNKTRRAGLCAPYLKIWQAFKRKENSIDPSWDVDWDKAEEEEEEKEGLETDGNGKEQTGARA